MDEWLSVNIQLDTKWSGRFFVLKRCFHINDFYLKKIGVEFTIAQFNNRLSYRQNKIYKLTLKSAVFMSSFHVSCQIYIITQYRQLCPIIITILLSLINGSLIIYMTKKLFDFSEPKRNSRVNKYFSEFWDEK